MYSVLVMNMYHLGTLNICIIFYRMIFAVFYFGVVIVPKLMLVNFFVRLSFTLKGEAGDILYSSYCLQNQNDNESMPRTKTVCGAKTRCHLVVCATELHCCP